MILAVIQQCFIFIVLYNINTNHQFEEHECENEYESKLHPTNIKTDLAVVHDLKWVLREEYLEGLIIDDRFKIGELLGDGFTGFVRSGLDLKTKEEVAIKFSPGQTYYSLEKEYINYLYLSADEPEVTEHGIPHIINFGDFAGYKVLIMTKAGLTLHDVVKKTRHRKFEFSTICKIGMQAVRIFEYIHSKGLLFHDVKPTNIAIDNTNENKIIFFDFAFSEFYENSLGESKEREDSDEINGTPEYMARGPLNRLTHVRKDDFISFGLSLLELNGVDLPWMDKTSDDDDIYDTMDIVLDEWEKYSIEEMCKDSDNPNFFINYFEYFDSIKSQDCPDYDYLMDLFASQLTDDELEHEKLGIVYAPDEYEDNNETNTPRTSDYRTDTNLPAVDEFQIKPSDDLSGAIINERFVVNETLAHGYTGFVRNGRDMITGEEVAIKFAVEKRHTYLEQEFINYLHLGADDREIVQYGIPHVTHFGNYGEYKVLIMTKTGPTLHKIRKSIKTKRFGMDVICKIAIQGIRTIQYIHSKGLVFQDVKPQHIAIDNSNKSQLYFLDFALCDSYVNALGEPKDREHANEFIGSPDYMARGPLNGFTHVRKDDFISFGLALLVLNGVNLPWMYKEKKKYRTMKIVYNILKQWDKYGIEGIYAKSDNPELFSKYFTYFDEIKPQDEPDHDFLVKLFSKELTEEQLASEDLGIPALAS